MKNTNCGNDCPFVKTGFCNSDKECPNYVESWWIEGQTQEHVLIKDCSPKRMMLQSQYMQLRLEAMQSALEKDRHTNLELIAYLKNLISSCKNLIETKKDEKIHFIDDKSNIDMSNSDTE